MPTSSRRRGSSQSTTFGPTIAESSSAIMRATSFSSASGSRAASSWMKSNSSASVLTRDSAQLIAPPKPSGRVVDHQHVHVRIRLRVESHQRLTDPLTSRMGDEDGEDARRTDPGGGFLRGARGFGGYGFDGHMKVRIGLVRRKACSFGAVYG